VTLPQAPPAAATAPGFPRDEFGALLKRLPRYGRLAWVLARDPRLSRARRLAVLAGAAYVISPIDLVPGIIPVAGQLDDLFVGLAAIRLALDGLKPEYRAARLGSVGLTQADLDADVRAAGAIAVWLGRSGVSAARRLGAGAVEAGTQAGERLAEVGRGIRRRFR
jgi:uncharacterized membrane protein YkvA (DUF1232 family)